MNVRVTNPGAGGFGCQVPPSREQVAVYFDQAGVTSLEAERYFEHYASRNWNGSRGKPVRNWKTKAGEWIWNLKLMNPHLRYKY